MATISHYMADPEVRKRSWRMRLEMGDRAARAQRGPPRARAARAARRAPHADHPERRRAAPEGRQLARGDRGDPRHAARGDVHGVRRARTGRARARARAGGRRRPGVPELRRHPQDRDDLVRAEPRDRRICAAPSAPRRAATCCSRSARTLAVYPVAGVVPIAKSHGARIVILNAEPHRDGRSRRRAAARLDQRGAAAARCSTGGSRSSRLAGAHRGFG